MRTHINFPVALLGLVALPFFASEAAPGLESIKTGDPAKAEIINKNFRYLDSTKADGADFLLLKSAVVAKIDRSELNGRKFSDFAVIDSVDEKLLTKTDSQKVVQILSNQLRAGISLTDSTSGYSANLSGSALTFYRKPSASMSLSIGSIVFSNLKAGVRPQSMQLSSPNEISFSFDGATSGDVEKVLTVSAAKSLNGQGINVLGNINLTGTLIAPTKALPDFVFSPNYKLASLPETKAYIAQNGHLPNVPSAKDVEKSGMDLVQMNLLLLQKVEELTLHAIAQQEQIEALKARIPAP